jgi:hypothetical protein
VSQPIEREALEATTHPYPDHQETRMDLLTSLENEVAATIGKHTAAIEADIAAILARYLTTATMAAAVADELLATPQPPPGICDPGIDAYHVLP